jgi:hypothetical protein
MVTAGARLNAKAGKVTLGNAEVSPNRPAPLGDGPR